MRRAAVRRVWGRFEDIPGLETFSTYGYSRPQGSGKE